MLRSERGAPYRQGEGLMELSQQRGKPGEKPQARRLQLNSCRLGRKEKGPGDP